MRRLLTPLPVVYGLQRRVVTLLGTSGRAPTLPLSYNYTNAPRVVMLSAKAAATSSGEAPRLAATVIICRQAARESTSSSSSALDYEVLFVKRHSKARFMPDFHVFPGGTVEVSDFEAEWSEYLSHTRHPSGNAFVSSPIRVPSLPYRRAVGDTLSDGAVVELTLVFGAQYARHVRHTGARLDPRAHRSDTRGIRGE